VDLYPESKDSMIKLIQAIRSAYPDIKIVQNRGFTVIDKTAPCVDAVMFESFSSSYSFRDKSYDKADLESLEWTDAVAEKINTIRKEHPFIVLALDYASPDRVDLIKYFQKRSSKYNFLSYVTTISLNEVSYNKNKNLRMRDNGNGKH
jgi:hypothetical protein